MEIKFETLNRYKRQLGIKRSENTALSYYTDIKIFLEYVGKKLNIETEEEIIDKLDSDLAEDSMDELKEEKKYSLTSYNRKITSLYDFGEYLKDKGKKTINVFKTLTQYDRNKVAEEKSHKEEKEMLTVDELNYIIDKSYDVIINQFKGSRVRLMLALMYTTGMRISEVANIKIGDIDRIEYEEDFEKKYAYMVNVNKHKTSKTNGIKRVPIANKTLKLYEEYLEQREKIKDKIKVGYEDLLIISKCYKNISTKISNEDINALVQKCAIKNDKGKIKHITNHCGRVGYKTSASFKGGNSTVIDTIGGWTTKGMAKVYFKDISDEDVGKIRVCNIL